MIGQYRFDIPEVQSDSILCTSGCFTLLHKGHKDYLEAFIFLSKLLQKEAVIFLNSSEYILNNKHIFSDSSLDELLLSRNKYFDSLDVKYHISDNGLEEYDIDNAIWYCGKEYTERYFKEHHSINPRVNGNVYYYEEAVASSSSQKDISVLWNIKNTSSIIL